MICTDAERDAIMAAVQTYGDHCTDYGSYGLDTDDSDRALNKVAESFERIRAMLAPPDDAVVREEEPEKKMSFRDAAMAYFSMRLTERRMIAEELGVTEEGDGLLSPEWLVAKTRLLRIQERNLQEQFIAAVLRGEETRDA